MNPLSLLVMPREVLQEMRLGSPPHRVTGAPTLAPAMGFFARELHEFGREFWASMLSPPSRRGASGAG